jgi:hypothetical protein
MRKQIKVLTCAGMLQPGAITKAEVSLLLGESDSEDGGRRVPARKEKML